MKTYKYLGISIQSNETASTLHRKHKSLNTIQATANSRCLRKLSLETAIKLFYIKIVPVLMVWQWYGNFKRKRPLKWCAKAAYLKNALSLTVHSIKTSKHTCNTRKRMMFRVVFWDILPCKIIVNRRFRGVYCLHHLRMSHYREPDALAVAATLMHWTS
jgi:hypothetical protein